MNVWYHLSTIFSQRRTLRIAVLLTLCVAFITMLFLNVASYAAPGVNQTISFQGRLLNAQGNVVPDGFYNLQFKIYQDGSGVTAGNPDGTLKWAETHINNGGNNGVQVKNGYFSVNLGALTPFGTSVDWNQDTLWLSMNVAGASAGCSTFNSAPCVADGEMLPMKRLTSTPYSINSGMVGGKTSDDLIHNGSTAQTAGFNITGTGIAGILQGSTSVLTPMLDVATAGILSIGTTNATSIAIGSLAGDQTVSIGTGSGNNNVAIGSASGTSSVTIQGGSMGVAIKSEKDVSVALGETGTFTIRNNDDEDLFTIQGNGDTLLSGNVTTKGGVGAQSADGNTTTTLSSDDTGTGTVTTTGNTLQLQGGAVPISLLTAVNNNGVANIGIGNAGDGGYALDVTGQVNASDSYLINGVSVLSNNALQFAGTGSSTITAAEGSALQLSGDNGVKIGDGSTTGEPTLLTLDSASGTPVASGEGVYGSMYYDTTLGKVQCYEADGWGNCSSAPDNFVTLSPEYANAVTTGTGTGKIVSDICSDTLNLNDGSGDSPTICGENETFNFYGWSTEETSAQTKDIFVTYQLPSSFTGFVDGSLSLLGRTDSADANVKYQVYKNTGSGLVACGTSVAVSTGVQSTWQKATASGSADPANCSFSASDSLVIKISLTSEYSTKAANAYASTLSFAFSHE